jgi:hypothetical protein
MYRGGGKVHFALFRVSVGLFCACVMGALAQTPPPECGGISRVVLDSDNVPVRRAIVTVSTLESPPQDAVAWTDANGRFSFSNVPAGRYQLRVSKTRF